MIINREVLNSKPIIDKENYTDIDLFEYTLEVASVMNNDITMFMEAGLGGGIKKAFDFKAIINAIIDALISAIKKLFSHFLAFLAQLASMGSSFEIELRRFKDKIKAMDNSFTLDFPYYEFTNISGEYPPFNVYNHITDIITYYDSKFNEIMKSGSVGVPKLVELQQQINLQDKQNIFRGELLGSKGNTTEYGDYATVLFNFFRNNDSTPKNNVVIPGKIVYDKFYVPYIDAKAEINKIKKEQNNVEKSIKQIKNKVNKEFFSMNLSMYSDEVKEQISTTTVNIQRQLCSLVDLIAQDLLLFYGQKLQAYKDFKAQSRKVLVAAIKACIIQ